MFRQVSLISLSENYYGILIVPEGNHLVDLREVFRKNTSYIVDEDTLVFIVTSSTESEENYLFFPLKNVKKFPFYISILLCVSPVEEVKTICTYEFTEREIGEARGFFRALLRMVETSAFLQTQ